MSNETVHNTLVSFYTHMHKWETDCAHREAKCESGVLDFDESERIAKAEYQNIFSKYCTKSAIPRDFHYSDPPEYNPKQLDIERVEDADDGAALVYMRVATDPNERIVIRLLREGNGWRINDKSIISATGDVIEANL